MSQLLIRKAFEKRLALMSPALTTKYENKDFTPIVGTPYQKVFLLPAQPDNATIGAGYFKEVGLFQITLCYPQNTGPSDAQLRAELVKTHFKRGNTMLETGLTINVTKTPSIATGYNENDRYCIPISIFYECDINL